MSKLQNETVDLSVVTFLIKCTFALNLFLDCFFTISFQTFESWNKKELYSVYPTCVSVSFIIWKLLKYGSFFLKERLILFLQKIRVEIQKKQYFSPSICAQILLPFFYPVSTIFYEEQSLKEIVTHAVKAFSPGSAFTTVQYAVTRKIKRSSRM